MSYHWTGQETTVRPACAHWWCSRRCRQPRARRTCQEACWSLSHWVHFTASITELVTRTDTPTDSERGKKSGRGRWAGGGRVDIRFRPAGTGTQQGVSQRARATPSRREREQGRKSASRKESDNERSTIERESKRASERGVDAFKWHFT